MLLLLSFACFLMAATAQSIPTVKNDRNTERSIDAILSGYGSKHDPGASVLVMRNDTILFSKSYGVKNINSKASINAGTNFRLASVTKQFTATCILFLEQEGQLSITDKISKYLQNLPGYTSNIRINQLLNHSSGLPDYEDLIPELQTEQVQDKDCLTLLKKADSLYFVPGTAYRYSNTGYALLALIIEKVSGTTFATFLQTHIFKPLNMTTTVAFENGISTVKNRAFGHSFTNNSWELTDQSNSSAVLGDGGIYSNTLDLLKWISALWNYKVLSAPYQQKAWTKTSLNNGQLLDYGYGWHIEAHKNGTHPYHSGSSIGFRNYINVFPEEKLMVVVLSNRNSADPKTICKKITSLFLQPE